MHVLWVDLASLHMYIEPCEESAPALLPTPYSTGMGGCKSSHWWNNDLKSKKPSRGLKICTGFEGPYTGQKGNILLVL